MTVNQDAEGLERDDPIDFRKIMRSTSVRAQLVACVHGRMGVQPGGVGAKLDSAASLLIFKFTLEPSQRSHRLENASIQVEFTTIDESSQGSPVVAEIWPSGIFDIKRTEMSAAIPVPSSSHVHAEGVVAKISGKILRNDSSYSGLHIAQWKLYGGSKPNEEIPISIQLAALVERQDDAKFRARFRILTNLVWSTGRDTIISLPIQSNDSVTFDPSKSFGALPSAVDLEELGRAKLRDLFKVDFRPLEPPEQTFEEEWVYVEIWSAQLIGSVVVPDPSTQLNAKIPGFEGLPCVQHKAFYIDSLEKHFSWARGDKPSSKKLPQANSTKAESKRLLSTGVFKTPSNQAAKTNQSKGLLKEEILQCMEQYFGLPTGIRDSLVNDVGSCQRVECGRNNYAYVVQTPFYETGMWAIVLVTDKDFEKGSAIIHSDSTRSMAEVLRTTQKGVSALRNYSHPLRLLLEIYLDHYRITGKKLEVVSNKVKFVDDEIEKELQIPHTKWAKQGQTSLARLSQTLHEARKHISELSRRLQFENQICMRLQEDLANDDELTDRVRMYSALTRSHAAEVKVLPDRISSQSTVLYSLISQRDANSQYFLAAETARDSKAMKTLAVITIVFLPGTFVATLFSTDIFDFQPGQEGKIYAAVVVPFTCLVFLGWLWWMKMKPSVLDGISQAEKGSKQC